jgi:soluble lytic murein transglycosylase-like protein
LHKLQSDPAAREQFYKELENSFDTIHNQQAVPVPKPPDSGQPQASLSTYDDIFTSIAAQPVTFTRPEIREETLPLVVPMTPPVSSTPVNKIGVRDLVVYWSKKNNVPAELALAVAYQESRFVLHPPRGSAGEIGPMQIMPERCRAEGYPPSRLLDPGFNIWLGTKLLARYFAEERSYARAACKYVAGPAVFDRQYSQELQDYINTYAASVERYAHYFAERV